MIPSITQYVDVGTKVELCKVGTRHILGRVVKINAYGPKHVVCDVSYSYHYLYDLYCVKTVRLTDAGFAAGNWRFVNNLSYLVCILLQKVKTLQENADTVIMEGTAADLVEGEDEVEDDFDISEERDLDKGIKSFECDDGAMDEGEEIKDDGEEDADDDDNDEEEDADDDDNDEEEDADKDNKDADQDTDVDTDGPITNNYPLTRLIQHDLITRMDNTNTILIGATVFCILSCLATSAVHVALAYCHTNHNACPF